MKCATIMLAAILLAMSASCAAAKRQPAPTYDPHGFSTTLPVVERADRQRHTGAARHHRKIGGGVRRHDLAVHGVAQVTVVGARPAGCPHRYCGCGSSLLLFGHIRPELNLAANWIRKFPRTHAAPHMAAARPGHVMVLLADRGRDNRGNLLWLVYDSNSGGGLTRVHVRSIKGYVIVNPFASRVARL